MSKLRQKKKKLTPETQQFFKDNPELWRVYANMDPDVRKVLTLCNSPCIPSGATAVQGDRIKAFLSSSGLPGDHPGLKKYFHDAADLDAAINKIDELAGKLDKNVLDSLLDDLGGVNDLVKLLDDVGEVDDLVLLLDSVTDVDQLKRLLIAVGSDVKP